MFKLIKFALIIGMIVGAYAWLSPYRTVQNLTQALENEDVQAVQAYVDFDRVRESFQNDFAQKMNIETSGNPLGTALATRIAGAFISGIVSPETMVTVLKDKERRDRLGLASKLGDVMARGEWIDGAHFVLHDDYGNPTMLLERTDTKWEVVAVRLN